MLLLAIAFVLVGALAAQAGVSPYSLPPIDLVLYNLCLGVDVQLATYSQLEEIAPRLADVGCPEATVVAVQQLDKLIGKHKSDLCSGESIDDWVQFYKDHLDTSRRYDQIRGLPRAFRRFALAYGMQLSNQCRKDMARVIFMESHKLLKPSDFGLLQNLVQENGPVDGLMSRVGEPGEVFVPADLIPLRKVDYKKQSLGLQAATGPYVKKVLAVCERRFKPVYAAHMLNLNRLANTGFSYRDEAIARRLHQPDVAKELNMWTRIVYLCEALGGVELVKESQRADGTNKVRALARDEARTLEGVGIIVQPEGKLEIPHLDYEPRDRVQLDDTIYDQEDWALAKAVKDFNTSRRGEDILFGRVSGMAWKIFQTELGRGHFGNLLASATKGVLGIPVINPIDQLIKTLDRLIKSKKIDPSA